MSFFDWPSAPKTWVAEMVTVPNLNDEIRDRMNLIQTWLKSLPDLFYPVGSIYYNASVPTNPGTLLGFGTWTLWGAGRVAVCVDVGQTEFDTLEETGGEKTHTLTTGEMPAHPHAVPQAFGSGGGLTGYVLSQVSDATSNTGLNTTSAGGGSAHNNLQPYITVYAWKRIA